MTGGATYVAEFLVKDVAHGVLVLITVARGEVTKIDTAAAEKAPSVLAVITHRNAGKGVLPEKVKALVDPKVGRPLQALQDDQVHYHGQPIAVVVADTFERATHAATLVRATYDEAKAVLDFVAPRPEDSRLMRRRRTAPPRSLPTTSAASRIRRWTAPR